MNPPVDTSGFQLEGVPDPEEDAQLAELEAEARDYVLTRPWSKSIGEMLLAFGGSRILDGDDLEGAYPVAAAPTEEHARMLKSRLEFIRENIIPMIDVGRGGASAH